jgi:tetratricopeptide (TPR) repeat protein
MELVDGDPIDEFCDRHRLSVPQVLHLFLDVCFAIAHAHQKGVVHRDLKPSNIIVAVGEDRPIPKIIDFGIARALWPSEDDTWHPATDRQIVGTPGYMSPEQIARDVDIDTRADVYALGGILYKLLAGVEPWDPESLQKLDLAAAYQRMGDAPVPRPSLRFQSLDASTQQQVASCRQSHPGSLRRLLTGELDWITMRALEKDRDRRYGTIQELAADLQRFLRHEPVSAGPSTAGYRLKKLVRRNWMAALATMTVAGSLLVGGTLATIGFVRATQASRRATGAWQRAEDQRRLAAAEADKARHTLTLLEQMVGASHPDRGHPADYTMRQLLDDFADSFDDDLAGQPEVAARLHRTIGRAYWSLGDMPRAGQHLTRSLELCSRQFGDQHLWTAEARVDFALYLMRMSRVREARVTVERALGVLRQHPADESMIRSLSLMSRVHHELAEHEVARQYIFQARDIARRALGPKHPLTISVRMRASMNFARGAEADRASEAALNDILDVRPAGHVDVADAKRQRAVVLARQGRFREAEALVREAMEGHERLLGPQNSSLAEDMILLTRIARQSQRHEEAIQLARQTVDLAERVTLERDILRHKAYRSLALLLEPVSPREAIDVWEKAIQAKRQVVGQHVEVGKLLHRQAGLFVRLEELTEAADRYQRSLQTIRESTTAELAEGLGRAATSEIVEAVYFNAAVDLLGAWIALDRMSEARAVFDQIRQRAGDVQFDLAAAVVHMAAARMKLADGDLVAAEQSIDNCFTKLAGSPHLAIRARAVLVEGQILTELERFPEAQRTLVRAYRVLRRRRSPPDHFEYSVAKQLALLAERRNRPLQAAAWMLRAESTGGWTME